MSYTVKVKIEKTAQSPADAFDRIPKLEDFATTEQLLAYREAYPNVWSVDIADNAITITNVFDSKEIWDAQQSDPITMSIIAARKAWALINHVTLTLEFL